MAQMGSLALWDPADMPCMPAAGHTFEAALQYLDPHDVLREKGIPGSLDNLGCCCWWQCALRCKRVLCSKQLCCDLPTATMYKGGIHGRAGQLHTMLPAAGQVAAADLFD